MTTPTWAPGPVAVRPAAPEDAAAIGDAHVQAWRAAYAGLMPQDYLDALSVERRAAGWRRLLEEPREGSHVAVVLLGGRVAGFAGFGRCRDGGPAEHGELYAINLHPGAWGLGAGTALLSFAERELAHMRHTTAVLWVAPGNARARRFYERRGWTAEDVERTAEVDGVTVPEIRYGRSLDHVGVDRYRAAEYQPASLSPTD